MSVETVLFLIPIIFFSVVLHEIAHGYVALRLGDPTASRMGRLTLNPIPHIDPFGTVLLPFLLIVLGSKVLFAWAKPVPVNPAYFRNPRQGMVYVALAGPATNFVLAILFAGISRVGVGMLPNFVLQAFLIGVVVNVVLMTFNLVPVPPLDGSKVVARFLKGEAYRAYMQFERFGILIVVLLLYAGVFSKILIPVLGFALKVFGLEKVFLEYMLQ